MVRTLILFSALIFSCQGASDRKPSGTDSGVVDRTGTEGNKSVSCKDILTNLIKTSNAVAFDQFSKTTVQAKISHKTSEKATIKLYVISDVSENPSERRLTEQAVGWLEYYKPTGKLMDITNDPDRPLELKYDKTVLQGHDLFRLCDSETVIAKPGAGYEQRDVMLEKDIRFNGKVKRFFALAEFEQFFGKPDSIRLLADEEPCITIFNTEAPDDKYLYKNGSRFETSKDSVAVDEYWFQNGNFITYKGIRIDANTTMDDIKQLFPTAVSGRLGMDKEGKLWVIKLKEDEKGISDRHIKLFFKNNKVYFIHWWLPC